MIWRRLKQKAARNVRGSIFDRVFDVASVKPSPAQAATLDRLIVAMDGQSQQAALDVANAMTRVPGRAGACLDALGQLDDAALAALAQGGLLPMIEQIAGTP